MTTVIIHGLYMDKDAFTPILKLEYHLDPEVLEAGAWYGLSKDEQAALIGMPILEAIDQWVLERESRREVKSELGYARVGLGGK